VAHIRGWNEVKGRVMEMITWRAEVKTTRRTYLKDQKPHYKVVAVGSC
jgi:hypothetical protein